MKFIPTFLILALFAGILVQGVSAEEPAYTFVTAWGGQGSGEYSHPYDVAVDTHDYVYVADTGNNRIQRFDANGDFPTDVVSVGPVAIAVDTTGIIYTTGYNCVEKYDSSGNFLTKWGSYGSGDGQFVGTTGIAVDPAGNVYVADTDNNWNIWNHRIQKFSSTGVFLTKWGSLGESDGQFRGPGGIAVDAGGNVYVTDISGDRIQKFDADGAFLTKWGSRGSGDGNFSSPQGIAVDSAGNVYVADTENHRIQKFDANGNFLTTWGSYGSDDGNFNYPHGIAVDSNGNVYVADTENDRIQKFAPLVPPVRDTPVADAGGDRTGTVGWAVSMDGTNSSDPNDNIIAYTWTFSEGGSATGPIFTKVYDAPGTYYATLTVTDATGLSDSDMIQITVTPVGTVENESPMEATERLIGEIEALNLPRGTERSMVTKLEEVLRYLEHANAKLAAVTIELEDQGSPDLVDTVQAIIDGIRGDGYGLAAISPGNSAASAYEKPLTISPSTGPEPPAQPDDPDQDEEAQEKNTDKKEKKDHPVKPDK